MAENNEIYLKRWGKLIEAAANIQGLLPGSVIIGGSAAIHLQHRYSFDADHILSDLKENYGEVLDFLEGRDDWRNFEDNAACAAAGSGSLLCHISGSAPSFSYMGQPPLPQDPSSFSEIPIFCGLHVRGANYRAWR